MDTVHPAPDFALAGRRVLVAGLGESGLAMARWCARHGATVRMVDTREVPPGLEALRVALPGVPVLCSALSEDTAGALLDDTDLLAWSPGLSTVTGEAAAFLWAAQARGIECTGELDLFARGIEALRAAGHDTRVLAITGTNGKTTTTRLCGTLCEAAGRSVAVAGNVSPAMLDVLGEALEAGRLPDIWVLELSSFQLALAGVFQPDAAVILNISQDHLDWHGSMAGYAAAKHRIHPGGGVCVWNRDDAATQPPAGRRAVSFGLDAPEAAGDTGIVTEGGLRWLAECEPDEAAVPGGRRKKDFVMPVRVRRLMPADALRLRGRHNQANALAALALARAVGLPMAPMLHALRDYAGEPHRCEPVAVLADVEYIDDSKGTNVGATVAALEGLGEGRRRLLLICGGDGKGQDFASLAPAVAANARAVFTIGRDAPAIEAALAATGVPTVRCATLPDAVREAAARAGTGDAVLLSPACASFDMFRGYAHRAEVFAAAVRELAEEVGQPC